LKLKYDELLSNAAFNVNVRRYFSVTARATAAVAATTTTMMVTANAQRQGCAGCQYQHPC
jgi:hypothetical protein